jgi:type IV secretion system protein VirB6
MGIGASVEGAIDLLLNDYVSGQVASLSSALSPVAGSVVTIYILFTAKAILAGELSSLGAGLLGRLLRICLVVGLALQVGNYQEHIVRASTDLEQGIIGALSGAASVGQLVDDMSEPYSTLGNRLWDQAVTGMWPNFALLAAAGGVAIIQCALFIVGLGMYLLAKIGLVLMLALGPIFILCGLSNTTQKYTENWVGQVLNFIVLKILVATSIQMLTDFTSTYAAHIDADMEAVNVLKAVIALFCCGGALFVVMLNLPHIATALTGGATMAGIGRTVVNAMMFRNPVKRPPAQGSKKSGGSIQQRATSGQHAANSGVRSPLYQRNTLGRLHHSTSRRTS